jgi:hypothetical protein
MSGLFGGAGVYKLRNGQRTAFFAVARREIAPTGDTPLRKSEIVACALSMTVGLAAGPALAKIPYFAAKCPTDISVETDRAGRAYLSGKRATVHTLNANAFEIRGGGVTIDVMKDAGGLSASYTAKHGANGVCQIVEQETVSGPASGPAKHTDAARAAAYDDVPKRDKDACLRAVKRKTHNPKAVVLEAVSSQANNTVKIGVGPDKAPWKCLVNRGRVGQVMSLTNEGAM